MVATNLPHPLTSFVGRERELADTARRIGSARLLTLTGAGGCGKTRLALQAAITLQRTFPDGIWLVNLVLLREPALLPQVVAHALGVPPDAAAGPLDALVTFLQPKSALLILDNCEHLPVACADLVQTLLQQTPALHVLATSRALLGVAGEQRYHVPPLALPPPDAAGASPEELLAYDAVRLFVARAQAVLPDFRLTAANADAVVTICRRLDGIPLALELAAARIRLLSAQQIADRLADRFALLVGGPGGGQTAHHATLRATMDWSYALLSPDEQRLLRYLAVFVAGFALDMVEAIAPAHTPADILMLLSSLIDKSLVVADTLAGPQARYRLLETVREYALAKLDATQETQPLHDRYLALCVARAEETAPRLTGPAQQQWFNWLEGEHDHMRAALAWALASGQIAAGLRLALALYQFWAIRNYWQEGMDWFGRLLARAEDAGVALALHVNACTYAAFLAEWRGHSQAAIAYGRRAVALAESADADAQQLLGFALAGLESALKVAGDYPAAYAVNEQYLAVFRPLGDEYSYFLGMGLLVQGENALALGKLTAARALLEEGLVLAQQANDSHRRSYVLMLLGDLARCEGHAARAQPLYEQSVALFRALGDERDLATALHRLGHSRLEAGAVTAAAACFNESLALHEAQRHAHGMAECLIGFAALAGVRGRPAVAAQLLAAVKPAGWPRNAWEGPVLRRLFEQTLAAARAALPAGDFAAAQAAGGELSLVQAVALARQVAAPLPPGSPLTAREREIAALVAGGQSNGEIAAALVLSKRTVEKHIANILGKLGLVNRAQLVRWALEQGLGAR